MFVILSPILLTVKTRTKNNPPRLRDVTTEPAEPSTKRRTLITFLPRVVSSPQQVLMAPNWGKYQSLLPTNPCRPSAPPASPDTASLAENLSWVNYITRQAGGEGDIRGQVERTRNPRRALCLSRGGNSEASRMSPTCIASWTPHFLPRNQSFGGRTGK